MALEKNNNHLNKVFSKSLHGYAKEHLCPAHVYHECPCYHVTDIHEGCCRKDSSTMLHIRQRLTQSHPHPPNILDPVYYSSMEMMFIVAAWNALLLLLECNPLRPKEAAWGSAQFFFSPILSSAGCSRCVLCLYSTTHVTMRLKPH
jgi:hypothetical protein